MKRFASILAPALCAGALMSLGMQSKAQAPLFSLNPSASSINAGASVDVVSSVMSGLKGTTTLRVSAVQITILFDPAVFDFVSFTANPSSVFNDNRTLVLDSQLTYKVDGTLYTGYIFSEAAPTGKGWSDTASSTDIGTLKLTAKTGTEGKKSTIFYSTDTANGGYKPSILADKTHTTDITGLQTSGNAITNTLLPTKYTSSPTNGTGDNLPISFTAATVSINGGAATPGPSALLVFAAGGAAPMMTMLRRRRLALKK